MTEPNYAGLSILLVDDDKALTEALQQYLENVNFTVSTCRSYADALQALTDPNCRYHIILADLKLPDGDGLEVIKRAKQKDQNVLTAVMTGYATLETALEAIRLGAYDYITKPFGIEEIEILIQNMTDKIRLIQQHQQAQQKLQHVYSKLETLQEEKIELMRAHREIRSDMDIISRKLDQMINLFRLFMADVLKGQPALAESLGHPTAHIPSRER